MPVRHCQHSLVVEAGGGEEDVVEGGEQQRLNLQVLYLHLWTHSILDTYSCLTWACIWGS
jgi:hypothetical protein